MAVIDFTNNQAPYISGENLNEIQKGNVYSTNEIEIGRWINGKPIYRKTVDLGYLNSGIQEISHNISNVNLIVNVESFFYNETNNTYFPIPRAYPTDVSLYQVSIDVGKEIITLTCGSNFNGTIFKGYATIEYTKTTD
jgi:hypothetical protein